MKIQKKVISLFIILIIIMSFFCNISNAAIVDKFKGTGVNFNGGDTKIKTIIGSILQVVRIVGGAIAAAILMIIGTKYMLGAAGDRAEIKKYAVIYIIGALILFGAPQIVDILVKFAEGS